MEPDRHVVGSVLGNTDQIVAHLTDGSGRSKAIRVEGYGGLHASADINAEGHVAFTTSYDSGERPPQGEQGAVEACALLVLKLNRDGEDWEAVERREGPEDGVDCVAHRPSGPPMQMAVTRVGAAFRGEMGRRGSTDQRLTAEQVAAHAEQAVAEKVDRKDTSLALRQAKVMVLDALDLPGFTASGVVDVLRSSPSATLSGYKYQAIWLVGPTVELVYRLDVPEND